MKKEDIILKLKTHPIFNGVEDFALCNAINSADTLIKEFKQGDEIFSPQNKEKKLGFVLLGEANVYSADGNRSVLLRSLKVGDMFGISNLFDENLGFVSLITAKKASRVIFFSSKAIEKLLNDSSEFRTNYIKFLSQRICFLNKKIACFTAGTPERRLAMFLCSQSEERTFSLNTSANSLSEMLDIGRASLYRALDKLISEGLISKNGKTITVLDRNTLEKNYL